MSAKGRAKREPAKGAPARAGASIETTAAAPSPELIPAWRARAVAAALLVAFAALSIHGMLRWSATYDEQVYAAAGFEQAEAGRFRFKRDAPPLVPHLAWLSARAASAAAGRRVNQAAFGESSQGVDEYITSQAFFRSQSDRGVFLLRGARLPALGFGVALGVYIYLFGSALFGRAGGLAALALFAFDPNMIAHSRILSADMALASLFLAAHFHCWQALATRSRAAVAATAFAAALAMLAKFTGLLVLPSLLGMAALVWLAAPEALREQLGLDRDAFRVHALRQALRGAAGIALTFLALSTLLYHGLDGIFRYFGAARSIYANIQSGYSNYFMGAFSRRPFAGYCLAAMALKTPVATLALGAWSAVAAIRARDARGGWIKAAALALPFLLIHAVAAFDQVNLGLRRVLFAYPFLFVFIGALAPACAAAKAPWRRALPWALASLAAAEPLSRHPNQLSFFNLGCGGPKSGWRYLDDSNIDWGQDLPALGALMKKRGIDRVALDYFGIDDPAAYGINGRPMAQEEYARPRREAYAVSVHFLIHHRAGGNGTGGAPADWLATRKPDAMAGWSIYLYDLREGARR